MPATQDRFAAWIISIAMIAWIALAVALFLYALRRLQDQRTRLVSWQPSYMELTMIWAVVAALWWFLAGGFVIERIVPIAAASILGLSAGTLLGFIFTSYSEESQSVGKVKDLILASIATLSLAELATGATHLNQVLKMFADPTGSLPLGVPLASIVSFSVLGFVGSFVLRELVLNISFAKARGERKRLESAVSDVQEKLKAIVAERAGLLTAFRDDNPITPETRELARHIVIQVRASQTCVETLTNQTASNLSSESLIEA